MKTILAHTNGSYMLLDGLTGCEISAFRPSVVLESQFIRARAGIGQVTVMAELKPEATDVEYARFLLEVDGDFGLANESFLAKFGIDAEATSNEEGEDDDTSGDEAGSASDDGSKAPAQATRGSRRTQGA